MIESIALVDKPGEVLRDSRQFTVDPPASAVLIPAVSAVINATDSHIDVEWTNMTAQPSVGNLGAQLIGRMIDQARRETARHPQSAKARTNLGLALLQTGDVSGAEEVLREALALDSASYVAAMALGKALLIRERVMEARTIYQRLAAVYDNDPGVLIGLAEIERQQGNVDHAAALLERVPPNDSRSAVAHYELGMILLNKGQTRQALHHLKEAARSDHRSARLQSALGGAYALAGELKRAKRAFQAALILAPRSLPAIHGLARVFLKAGDADDAIALLSDQLSHSDDTETRELLALALLRQHRLLSARTHFVALIAQLGSDQPDLRSARGRAHNNLGVVSIGLREFQTAEKAFIAAIDCDPSGSPIPYRNLARLHAKTARLGDASEVLRRARREFPSDSESSWLLAMILASRGQV